MSFWNELKSKNNHPIFSLAPMEDVTDAVFRRVIQKCGRPDVFFTEFTNCDGIQSIGQAKVIERLKYHKKEKPIVAQVWGKTLENYYQTAKLIVDLGFDGIDINMGCPVKNVIKNGNCSALIKNPQFAKKIIEAVRDGVDGKIPVSVKTRLGFSEIQLEDWIGFLLKDCNVKYLTIHGRTVSELTRVPCHFEEFGKIVEMKNKINKDIMIFGNGDITSYNQGVELCDKYGLDGVMIARAVMSNPWIFNKKINPDKISILNRIKLLEYHIKLFEKEWNGKKNMISLKKFYRTYINNFSDASTVRARLIAINDINELKNEIKEVKKQIKKGIE